VNNPSTGGGPGNNPNYDATKPNSIAAGVFIPVIILLAVGLHYLFSDHLIALGDKIKQPIKRLFLGMIVINSLVLLFVIAALGTNDWAHDGSNSVYIGLWQFCFSGNCVSTSNTVSGPLAANLQAVRVFAVFAFFDAIAALVLIVILYFRENNRALFSKFHFGCIVGLWILTFMSTCIWAALYNDAHWKSAEIYYGAGFGLTVFVWLISFFSYFLSYIIWKKIEKGGPSSTPKDTATPGEQTPVEQDVRSTNQGSVDTQNQQQEQVTMEEQPVYAEPPQETTEDGAPQYN